MIVSLSKISTLYHLKSVNSCLIILINPLICGFERLFGELIGLKI